MRTFLFALGLAGLGLVAAVARAADPPLPTGKAKDFKVRAALHSIGYSGVWRGQAKLTVDEFLRKAKQLGLRGRGPHGEAAARLALRLRRQGPQSPARAARRAGAEAGLPGRLHRLHRRDRQARHPPPRDPGALRGRGGPAGARPGHADGADLHRLRAARRPLRQAVRAGGRGAEDGRARGRPLRRHPGGAEPPRHRHPPRRHGLADQGGGARQREGGLGRLVPPARGAVARRRSGGRC